MQNQVVEVIATPQERFDYVDILRVAALIMVITIHVSANFFFGSTVGSKTWLIAHFFDTVSRPAVPIFIMVSGMLHLSSRSTPPLANFIYKRVLRVLTPLFFWSIIYFIWSALKVNEPIYFKEFFIQLLAGNVYYHLYFLYIIFGLYIITPLLKIFTAHAKKQDFLYGIGLWILAVSVIPLVAKFWGIRIYYLLIPITGFVGYYLAGYFLSTIPHVDNFLLLAIWIITNLVIYFGTCVLSNRIGELDQYFYDYLTLSVIASAFTVFIFCKQINISAFYSRYPIFKKSISFLSSISFAVYLLHLLILEMLIQGTFGVFINSNTFNIYIAIPVITAIVLIISGLIVITLRRIPIIRWLLP